MIELVRNYIKADVPVLLWGAPGTGKTSALLALAKEEGAHVEVLIGSTLDPIDVGGYLVPRNGEVESSAPPWARRLSESLARGSSAWLVLDELTCAPPSVQAALLRVVHERRVGSLSLAGCRVVAAGNPSDTAADGGELAAATANRWAHVDWQCDVSAWASGTLRGWGEGVSSPRHAAVAASVASFMLRHPKSLLAVPTGIAEAGRSWPSPRSWSAAIAAAAAAPDELARRMVAGCVGDGAAKEWHEYHTSRDLPDPEEVLAGRAEVPSRGDRVAATLAAVVAAAIQPHASRKDRVERAWSLLASQRADLGIVAATTLLDAAGTIPEVASKYAERLRKGGV